MHNKALQSSSAAASTCCPTRDGLVEDVQPSSDSVGPGVALYVTVGRVYRQSTLHRCGVRASGHACRLPKIRAYSHVQVQYGDT
jgi:hypothetical protein